MKNNERVWLWGIIGFLLGIVGTTFFASYTATNHINGMMNMMGIRENSSQAIQKGHIMPDGRMMMGNDMDESMSMQGMVEALKGKTGDEFDREFINQMIPHHQGAIDMARIATQSAGHDEIRVLANDIIAAQTNEIELMRQWQKDWGY